MKGDIITIKNMLKEMEKGEIFSITFVKYDRQRKTGGQKRVFPEAILHTKKKEKETAELVIGRPLTVVEQKIEELNALKSRQPNHHEHFTRNLILCVNGHETSEKRKFHPPLVLEFNGQQVVP